MKAAGEMLRMAMVAFAAANAAVRESGSDTRMQKVIQMLEGMLTKGKQDKHEEAVQFAAYKSFCDDTSIDKKRAIEEANEKIELLNADIEKYTTDSAALTKLIAGHDADIAAWTGDIKAATTIRNLEKADYEKTHQDYSESIEVLPRAIKALEDQSHDRSKASLLQLKTSSFIPPEAKKAIDAFLAQDPDVDLAITAPEAAGYEFQSHGIIEMLEKLLEKFETERTQLERVERDYQGAFDLLLHDTKLQIGEAERDRTDKSELKAKKLQAKADAEGELADTTATRDADQKYLDDLTATCTQKAAEFTEREQLRAEELEAVGKAIEVLSENAVGSADKYLPYLLQRGSSLAALRADQSSSAQAKAARFLRERASRLSSRVLNTLAQRVADDPFAKVKKMIKELLAKLMEEAGEEADHKQWCDGELATNEQTRKEKTDAIEVLHAEIDRLSASIAKLNEEMSSLQKGIAEIDAAVAKATEIRQEEKATNEKTIADAQEAQAAISKAMTVLKDFYKKAGEATSLVQQKPPEIFDSAYKGMQGVNNGVIGILEVVETDFARLEADTSAEEASAAKEYDKFMADSKADKESKTVDIETKTIKAHEEDQALRKNKEDLEGTQGELNAALEYFDKLKPSCIDAGTSYDDRVDRRKEEIDSLQQALKILNGEDI